MTQIISLYLFTNLIQNIRKIEMIHAAMIWVQHADLIQEVYTSNILFSNVSFYFHETVNRLLQDPIEILLNIMFFHRWEDFS